MGAEREGGGRRTLVAFLEGRQLRWWDVARLVLVPCGLAALAAGFIGEMQATRVGGWAIGILGGIAVNQVALALFVARMRGVLGLFGIAIKWGAALRVHLQSMFYFFVVPMSVGMEVARFAKVRHLAPEVEGQRLVAALLWDRGLGLAGSAVTALAIVPLVQLGDIGAFMQRGWSVAVVGVGALVMVGLLSWWRRREVALMFDAMLEALRQGWANMGLLALSVLMQVAMGVAVYLVGDALGFALVPWEVVFCVAVGGFGLLVPVVVAGAGSIELATAAAFLLVGASLEEAMVLAVVGYGMRLLGAIQGGVWEMWDGARGLVRRAEPETSVR